MDPIEVDPPEETKLQQRFGSIPPSGIKNRRYQLHWEDSTGEHSVRPERRTIIGSAAAAGIVVADPTVSRIHAELERRDDGLWVRDLGSRNGTFVEGVQVQGARVPDGGKLRVGSTVLVVRTHVETEVNLWPHDSFGPLIGASNVMRELFATLARVASLTTAILIEGETGTGKELVARAIHDESPRAAAPYIIVDCAALPETLLEAELFGHARGAFTGAVGARVGALEAADGGTLFLDEIGELPMSVQPKLLRFLESGTIRRLGEVQHRKVDVRIICATHRDLLTMVNANAFREDLYFRLAVIPLKIPPLRDRMQDLDKLVERFLPPNSGQVSADLMCELRSRVWRGNVRELRNFVQRAVALGTTRAIALERTGETAAAAAASSAPPSSARTFEVPFRVFRERWVDQGEREYVQRLLERHHRNVAAAAQEAEVDRTYLYRLVRKHSL